MSCADLLHPLQFQQALKRIDWPPELLQYLQHQEAAALGLTSAPWTSPVSPHTHGPSRLTANEARWKNIAAVIGEASSGGLVGGDLSRTSGDESHAVAAGPSREGSRFWSAISRPQRSSYSGSAACSSKWQWMICCLALSGTQGASHTAGVQETLLKLCMHLPLAPTVVAWHQL